MIKIIINKKGEFLTLAIITIVLMLAGLFVIGQKVEKKYPIILYVGDISTNITYSLRSSNSNCSFNNVAIERTNLQYFSNYEEAISKGFRIDKNCN